jgi:hypothetical protein
MKNAILFLLATIISISLFSQPNTKRKLKGKHAGLYVAQFAGANTHSYNIKFANGVYSGTYEENIDGEKSKSILKKLVVDEEENKASYTISPSNEDIECFFVTKDGEIMLVELSGEENKEFIKMKVSNSQLGIANKEKVFFYGAANLSTLRKAYIVKGQEIAILKTSGNFYEVSFMNEAGKETKGFMLTKEIDRQ